MSEGKVIVNLFELFFYSQKEKSEICGERLYVSMKTYPVQKKRVYVT